MKIILAVAVGAAILLTSKKTSESTNNPGNLRYNAGIDWRGQTGSKNGFATFDTLTNGIRANYINLRTSYYKHGNETVRELITRWAPRFENPTEKYIAFVSARSGLGADEFFTFNEINAVKILEAIFYFENGKATNIDAIKTGVAAA